jgi:hypothetical protein
MVGVGRTLLFVDVLVVVVVVSGRWCLIWADEMFVVESRVEVVLGSCGLEVKEALVI